MESPLKSVWKGGEKILCYEEFERLKKDQHKSRQKHTLCPWDIEKCLWIKPGRRQRNSLKDKLLICLHCFIYGLLFGYSIPGFLEQEVVIIWSCEVGSCRYAVVRLLLFHYRSKIPRYTRVNTNLWRLVKFITN